MKSGFLTAYSKYIGAEVAVPPSTTATVIVLIVMAVVLLLVCIGFVLFRLVYNRYLNKRLNGETEKRRFFNYKAFAVIMVINICIGAIAFLGTSLQSTRSELDHYKGRIDELYPRQKTLTADADIADFEWITDGVQRQDLSGYAVTKTTNGDFECYTARAKDTVKNNSLMPTLIVYFKYIGDELVRPQTEIHYTFLDWQGGSSVTHNNHYLYISRLYQDEVLLSIDIKISVDPFGSKNPQLHSQSHFDFASV